MVNVSHLRSRRLGNRGHVLLIGGFLCLVTAWTVGQAPIPTLRAAAPHEYIPAVIRELAWIVTGLVAMISAFFRQGRDKWGFAALILMPMERTLSWGSAILLHFFAAHRYPPLVLSVGQFALYTGLSLAILVIANWKEEGTVVLVPPLAGEGSR